MAAESDGELGMVANSVDEQPMDLSRASKKVDSSRSASDSHKSTTIWLSSTKIAQQRFSGLDRARSVPQLTPLPALQRHKSLSESRIAQPENDEAWLYVGYYSQLLHRFQTHFALQQHQLEKSLTKGRKLTSSTDAKAENPSDDVCDIKRRQARPLTGKHVRPGTGASPATLLTLRRKIQQRQQNNNSFKS
ncbi:hypothetical protein L9F63_024509 [Diploptera punctata]|uniref:Uncharacterized protein n=1 Tax=Diploptera punctata TaxID=6984 RepID=A0AAD7ZG77_DIPPU|nr:hypothetical protein L9F63_024509 [Diploptera punctata]